MKYFQITLIAVAAFVSLPLMAMTPLSDEGMSQIAGKGLFVSDVIAATGQSGSSTDFNFYRMGLDVELALNANIDKLQLGCGGFNETARANACDIDMDFVRLMGLDSAGSGPSPDGPNSDFVLTRPFIEIAVRGEGTNREVAGIRIGSQQADGYFGVGRTYANNQPNQESGMTCATGGNANDGTGRGACHSGINTLSAYLNVELSGRFPIYGSGIATGDACFGLTSTMPECSATDTEGTWKDGRRLFVNVAGTRMSELVQPVALDADIDILGFIPLGSAFATIRQELKTLHGFALNDTKDFSLSFQREEISYPTYEKDGYNYPANVGWWMNVPDVKVLDVIGDTVDLGFVDTLSALAYPGPDVINSELNVPPPNNCFGSLSFC